MGAPYYRPLSPSAKTQRATRPQRIYFIATGVLALLVPVVLQRLGWLPPSMVFADGTITILPRAVSFAPIATELYLLACSLMVIVVPAIVIGGAIDTLVRAERRLFAQAWNLRDLVPDEARTAVEASPEEPDDPRCCGAAPGRR